MFDIVPTEKNEINLNKISKKPLINYIEISIIKMIQNI
jgi:protein tyrosine phosphatase